MNPRYPGVAERAGHRCEYCRAPEAIFNLPFEVEHIVPLARGGADDESNLALSCRACNFHKSDHVDGVDPLTGTVVPLFHPRQGAWHEHFRITQDAGSITGVTASGRATVNRLRMNGSPQVDARLQWMRLGLFP